MKRLLLILPLVLCACEKHHNPLTSTPTPGQPMTILFAGQSNARNLAQQGGAAMLTQSLGRPVTVINCAVGGTSIAQWQKGQGLYEACITQAKGQKIDVVWFDQGEAEIEHGSTPDTTRWAEEFTATARNFTADFKCPVYYAKLSTEWLTWPESDAISAAQEMQRQQASISTQVAIEVDISDIGMGPTLPHYDTAHYQEIAERLANAVKL